VGRYGNGPSGGRPTVEGCQTLILDICRVMRMVHEAVRKTGHAMTSQDQDDVIQVDWFTWAWTQVGSDEPWAKVEVQLTLSNTGGTARLRYDVQHFSGATGPQEYSVRLDTRLVDTAASDGGGYARQPDRG
jgi:hypothetical protein